MKPGMWVGTGFHGHVSKVKVINETKCTFCGGGIHLYSAASRLSHLFRSTPLRCQLSNPPLPGQNCQEHHMQCSIHGNVKVLSSRTVQWYLVLLNDKAFVVSISVTITPSVCTKRPKWPRTEMTTTTSSDDVTHYVMLLQDHRRTEHGTWSASNAPVTTTSQARSRSLARLQGRVTRRRTAPSTTETGTGSWTGHSTWPEFADVFDHVATPPGNRQKHTSITLSSHSFPFTAAPSTRICQALSQQFKSYEP